MKWKIEYKTQLIVAFFGLLGGISAAAISNWQNIVTLINDSPVAEVGAVKQAFLQLSSDKTTSFGGLDYVLRPSNNNRKLTVDVLYKGNVVASHEIVDENNNSTISLAIGNCNFIQIDFAGRAVVVSSLHTGEKNFSATANVNISSTCEF